MAKKTKSKPIVSTRTKKKLLDKRMWYRRTDNTEENKGNWKSTEMKQKRHLKLTF